MSRKNGANRGNLKINMNERSPGALNRRLLSDIIKP